MHLHWENGLRSNFLLSFFSMKIFTSKQWKFHIVFLFFSFFKKKRKIRCAPFALLAPASAAYTTLYELWHCGHEWMDGFSSFPSFDVRVYRIDVTRQIFIDVIIWVQTSKTMGKKENFYVRTLKACLCVEHHSFHSVHRQTQLWICRMTCMFMMLTLNSAKARPFFPISILLLLWTDDDLMTILFWHAVMCSLYLTWSIAFFCEARDGRQRRTWFSLKLTRWEQSDVNRRTQKKRKLGKTVLSWWWGWVGILNKLKSLSSCVCMCKWV